MFDASEECARKVALAICESLTKAGVSPAIIHDSANSLAEALGAALGADRMFVQRVQGAIYNAWFSDVDGDVTPDE